jgi:cyclase
MFLNRVIPTILLDGNRLVKTKQFADPVYIGDPINVVQIFNKKEVNELIILNINAKRFSSEIDFNLLKEISSECFMPVSYGGGIQNINQIEKLLYIGFEKIIINSQALIDPEFVKEAVKQFGSSTIIGSLDYKILKNQRIVFTNSGLKETQITLEDAFTSMVDLGVGEIMVTSIINEGEYKGYDLEILNELKHKSQIPIIINGGASMLEDMKEAVDKGAQAVAAGSLFSLRPPHRAVLISYPSFNKIEKIFHDEL